MDKQEKEKLFYKIGEVCQILEIEAHTLRYWEKEFKMLTPKKNKSGQRIYSAEDLEIVKRIKNLLYEKGFTIEGARHYIEEEAKNPSLKIDPLRLAEENRKLRDALSEVRDGLRSIIKWLKNESRTSNK